MRYLELCETYERLEATSSKLKKAEVIAELLKRLEDEDLKKVILLLQGRVYPSYAPEELGVATQMAIRIVARVTGFSPEEIEKSFARVGDLGLVTEELVKKRKQRSLSRSTLTVDLVFTNLRRLAQIGGGGSQERKLELVGELLTSASPLEARYVIRTVLQDLRVGVAEGIIRDSIVAAFLTTEDKTEKKNAGVAVDYATNILSDFSEVATIAKSQGIRGLLAVKIVLGKPIQSMLGLAAESLDEVFVNGPVAIEMKYDGMRAQVHKKGDRVWVFTRRLEDVTNQFPDIVDYAKKALKRECVVEGEAWAIKDGRPQPFQLLSQRIQRKYDIDKMIREVPVQVNLFDIVYLDGEMLLDRPLKERRKLLEKSVKEVPGKFILAEQLVTEDLKEAEKFYQKSLQMAQEGVMIKLLDSRYVFGRHVGGWYKVKPIMETLDLVIIGATWGEGKRAKWLSSYLLACRDPSTDKLLACGMLSTGLTEQQYEEMTAVLKPLVVDDRGRSVTLQPKIVIEAGYQEIQKSPTYTSGYALRFPRLIRVRADKGPHDADTLERVAALFKSQGRRG